MEWSAKTKRDILDVLFKASSTERMWFLHDLLFAFKLDKIKRIKNLLEIEELERSPNPLGLIIKENVQKFLLAESDGSNYVRSASC